MTRRVSCIALYSAVIHGIQQAFYTTFYTLLYAGHDTSTAATTCTCGSAACAWPRLMSASKDPSLMSRNAAAGGQQRARADPSFHRRQESKHVLHCVHRCLLTFVHLDPSDAMLHRADVMCRIGSVCARPAPTSRAQTQASVLPRSCSGRSRRLLARASASLTRGERRSASKVLVPSGGRPATALAGSSMDVVAPIQIYSERVIQGFIQQKA